MTHGSNDDRARRRLAAIPVLVALVVLLGGCGGTDAAPSENTPSKTAEKKPEQTATPTSSKPAPKYTVEQLAAKLGCTATFQGPTKGFRQGKCTKDGEPFELFDFENAENQRLWLDDAIAFGGIYLVGDRWVLSGVSKEYMQGLSKTFGGTVEDRESYGS